AANDRGSFLCELRLWGVLQHTVVVSHPENVVFRRSQHRLRCLLFGAADAGEPLRVHIRIVRTLVIVGVDDDVHLIVITVQQSNSAARAEDIVVWMRRKQQNSLVAQVFKPSLLPVKETGRSQQCTEKNKSVPATEPLARTGHKEVAGVTVSNSLVLLAHCFAGGRMPRLRLLVAVVLLSCLPLITSR